MTPGLSEAWDSAMKSIERIAAIESMQHRGHPPREVLGAPDSLQAPRRVALQRFLAAGIEGGEHFGQHADVVDREVQTLRARRRDDVRRVPGEEEAARTHRLGDVASHRRDAFLQDRPFCEAPAALGFPPPKEI